MCFVTTKPPKSPCGYFWGASPPNPPALNGLILSAGFLYFPAAPMEKIPEAPTSGAFSTQVKITSKTCRLRLRMPSALNRIKSSLREQNLSRVAPRTRSILEIATKSVGKGKGVHRAFAPPEVRKYQIYTNLNKGRKQILRQENIFIPLV